METLALLLATALAGASPTQAGKPAATIARDEGGPVRVTGRMSYTAPAIETHIKEPVVALLDFSRPIQGNYREYVPRSGQVLGTLTSPLAPSPASFRVDLPIVPGGAPVDLDKDGERDAGVQVYVLVVGTNLVGDSYLEQVEQAGYASVLLDPHTGGVREGSLLVYAPDAAQRFPVGSGSDGRWFTADDPTVVLPAGYTLATLDRNGTARFDRSREAVMDTREEAAVEGPDFSGQGILESYHSLVDLLAVRYSYTKLRGIDWERVRKTFLPRVQAADAKGDMPAYYRALFDLAKSIRDAHVQVAAVDPQVRVAPYLDLARRTAGSLGAGIVETSDGRFVVTFLDPKGPGALAGWRFGTEILSVDGVPMGERVDGLPYATPESTPEGVRTAQLAFALSFPEGAPATVEYRQPGEAERRRATLTAAKGFATRPPAPPAREPISFKELEGGFGYVQWQAFDDPLHKIAVFEKFLEQFHAAPGIVIDLRDNGGGSVALFQTLASYLFTARRPAPLHWIDTDAYDERANGLVRSFAGDYVVSAPKPELAYTGAVVVLVNENSASAAEYMPQFLQRQGRALVVGQHGTDGAGGIVDQVALPGSITFRFTKGRSVFAGTDEPNLEAKGVTLDVRVPITEESERAKQEGRDPVLEAGLVALSAGAARRTAERLSGTTWQWTALLDASARRAPVENPAAYTLALAKDGSVAIRADCNRAAGSHTLGEEKALRITPGPTTLAACPPGSRGDEFVKRLSVAKSYELAGDSLLILLDPASGALGLELQPAP